MPETLKRYFLGARDPVALLLVLLEFVVYMSVPMSVYLVRVHVHVHFHVCVCVHVRKIC